MDLLLMYGMISVNCPGENAAKRCMVLLRVGSYARALLRALRCSDPSSLQHLYYKLLNEMRNRSHSVLCQLLTAKWQEECHMPSSIWSPSQPGQLPDGTNIRSIITIQTGRLVQLRHVLRF